MELKKLGDIFKISSGGTPSKKNTEYYENGTVPWIKTGDLKLKYIEKSVDYITEVAVKNSSAKLFPSETVLIAMYGATIGATSILKIDATTNQACAAFLPSDEVIPEYLYYFFKSNHDRIVNLGVGGAQPNISAKILKDIKIPYVNINEQNKIVAVLDKSQELIDKRKDQIEALDELVKSRFIEMFGDPVLNHMNWEVKQLSDVATVLNGRAYKQDELLEEGKTPVLRVGNFFTNRNWFYSNLELEEEKYCDNGDLLYAWSASFGPKIWDGGKVIYHYHIWKLVLNDPNVNKIYLYWLLSFLTEFLKRDTRGATMLHLTKSGMEKSKIIIPSIELQNQFADFINQVDKLKSEMENSLSELEDNFNSLMQKAFNGELFN